MPTANLDARFAALASLVISKDSGRRGLHGVHIFKAEHRPGAYLFASDGHRALVCYDKTALVERSFVLAVGPALRKAVFSRNLRALPPRLEVDHDGGGTMYISGGEALWRSESRMVMDCDPLNSWRAVLPVNHLRDAPSGGGSFNAKNIKDFAEIANKIRKLFHGQNAPGTMRINGADDRQPVEITFGQHPIYGVLMPVHSYHHEHDVSFLRDNPDDAAIDALSAD